MPNETDTRRRVTYPPQGGNPEIATAVGGFTSRDLIPQDAYALPMHRNPNDPPNTNYGDPYASRRHLPRYIGFPSKYPQVLPVETPTARGIVSALIQPWLLPMPDPIRLPPAPRGGGRVNKPADPPPADDKKQENTQTTTTATVTPAASSPNIYMGTTQLDLLGGMPASVVGGDGDEWDMRTDPNLTQHNPNGPFDDETMAGRGNRAAAILDAMEDLFAYRYDAGDLNPFAGQANAGISEAATNWARHMGLDREMMLRNQAARQAEVARVQQARAQQARAQQDAYRLAQEIQRGY